MGTFNFDANFMVVGRIKEGTKVLGYLIIDRERGKRIIKKDVFEQMALSKQIRNCTGHVYKDENGKCKVVLRGINMKLTELPAYNKEGQKLRKVR